MAEDQAARPGDMTLEAVEALHGRTLDLGGGVQLDWAIYDVSGGTYVIGAVRRHPSAGKGEGAPPAGQPCSSQVWFDVPALQAWRIEGRAIHVVKAWQPLHLEPSLLCSACGSHGKVAGGRWQPV